MSQSKKRYKAVIGDKNYTIIGNESKAHMDAVVSLANHQLEMIGKKVLILVWSKSQYC